MLASTSPQRRAILEQLAIPFEAVAPAFSEAPDGDPLEHAAGKARSVDGAGGPVLGVDTVVVCGGRRIGKPRDAAEAAEMLEPLGGRTHEVVSGLCLRDAGVGGAARRDDDRHVPPAERRATSSAISPPASGRAGRAPTRSRASGRAWSSGSRATT